MTYRNAISLVRKGLKEVNADSKLSTKFIYSHLNAISKLIIQQESDKLNLSRMQDLYQTKSCLDMEEAPAIDPCCGIRTLCTVWRTKDELPELYEDSFGVIIKRVMAIDYLLEGANEITLVTPTRLNQLKKDKNSKYDKTLYGFYHNKRIYTTNTRFKQIAVEGIFEEDISHLNCCGKEKNCTPFLDRKWYVPNKLEMVIVDALVKKLMDSYKRLTEDTQINKNDTI